MLYLGEATGLLDAAAEHGDEHQGGQADEVEASPAEPAPLEADGQTDGHRHCAEGVEGQQGSKGPTPAMRGELLHDHGDADGQFRADEYAGAELEDHERSEAPRQGGEGGEGGVADDRPDQYGSAADTIGTASQGEADQRPGQGGDPSDA